MCSLSPQHTSAASPTHLSRDAQSAAVDLPDVKVYCTMNEIHVPYLADMRMYISCRELGNTQYIPKLRAPAHRWRARTCVLAACHVTTCPQPIYTYVRKSSSQSLGSCGAYCSATMGCSKPASCDLVNDLQNKAVCRENRAGSNARRLIEDLPSAINSAMA